MFCNKILKVGFGFCLGFGSIFLTPLIAETVSSMPPAATERVPPKQPIASSNGSYSRAIKIVVPGFRGLEPNLSLTYDSSRSVRFEAGRNNQLLGLGWALSGASAIEAASEGRGAPSFESGAENIFMLDRSELVPCGNGAGQASSGSSCSTNGTHSTRIESYRKIKFYPEDNQWYVWNRDGTKFTYRSLGYVSGASAPSDLADKYRWVLTKVKDTHGNQVNYSYACFSLPKCYLETITYNETEIKFWRESRPVDDNISYASGDNIAKITSRYETISVKTSGTMVRAYKLDYEQSLSTKTSRLTKVQQFGRDVTIGSNGTISNPLSASHLPPHEFTYQDDGQGLSVSSWGTANEPLPANSQGAEGSKIVRLTGDFNGDGRTDIAYVEVTTNFIPTYSDGYWACTLKVKKLRLANSAGNGFFTQTTGLAVLSSPTNCGEGAELSTFTVGDFNGDGKSDIGILLVGKVASQTNNEQPVFVHSLHAFLSATTHQVMLASVSLGDYDTGNIKAAGDFNGDGKTDIIIRIGTYGATKMYRSTGTSFTWLTNLYFQANSSGEGLVVEPGDFNGDGYGDIIVARDAGPSTQFTVYISDGATSTGFSAQDAVIIAGHTKPTSWSLADFNGDGKSDLIRGRQDPNDSSKIQLGLYLSDGTEFVEQPNPLLIPRLQHIYSSGPRIIKGVGDFNGDGRSDIIVSGDGSNPRRPTKIIFISRRRVLCHQLVRWQKSIVGKPNSARRGQPFVQNCNG